MVHGMMRVLEDVLHMSCYVSLPSSEGRLRQRARIPAKGGRGCQGRRRPNDPPCCIFQRTLDSQLQRVPVCPRGSTFPAAGGAHTSVESGRAEFPTQLRPRRREIVSLSFERETCSGSSVWLLRGRKIGCIDQNFSVLEWGVKEEGVL
jgi:hypothetical protein